MKPDGDLWTTQPLAGFTATEAEMVVRFGPATFERDESNGLGADVWELRFPCGLEARLVFTRDFGTSRGFDSRADGERAVEVYASDVDRAHLQHHLGGHGWPPFLPDRLRDDPQVWCVRRIDDNGNTFDVAAFSHRCGADAHAATLSARGHKQTYWVDFAAPAL